MSLKLLPESPCGRGSFEQPFVHTLPGEILTKIFLLVRDSSAISSTPDMSTHDQVYTGNFALLRMAAVCLRWRLVAANFSVLWSNIVFSTLETSSIQCAELFLGRTKSCALHVYISAPALLDSHAIPAPMHRLFFKISSESHRIRVFEFFATPRTSILYTYWANPAKDIHRILGAGDATPSACVAFPLVESMRLSSPAWHPTVAPHLKNLDLRSNDTHVSLSSLLRALGGCPALESLTFQGYRQFLDENPPDPPVTTLPKLHRLRLFSCNSAPILAFLRLPSLTHPLVIFDSEPHEDLLRCLPQRQPGAPYLKGVSKLRVALNVGNSQYTVAAYREDGRMTLYLGVSTTSQLFKWRWIRESMETIASFDPFSEVTGLSITTDVIFASWSPWLSKMLHLSRLDLCCPDVTAYLSTLSASVDGSPPCPSLHTLALRGFHLSNKLDYGLLKACILLRRTAGSPLTSVLVPGDDWTRAHARDASWGALVDSQATVGDRILLCLSQEELRDDIRSGRG